MSDTAYCHLLIPRRLLNRVFANLYFQYLPFISRPRKEPARPSRVRYTADGQKIKGRGTVVGYTSVYCFRVKYCLGAIYVLYN